MGMLIVLVFVLIYYCVMPIYHSMRKRKEREESQTWENDPRWNGDTFRYMPKLPADFRSDKKYSRLAACSRSSSMRENPNPADVTLNLENETKPPNYSDLFSSSGSSLASTPPSYSSKTPSVENNATKEKPEEPKKKVRKTKKQIIGEAAAALAAKKA